MERLDKGHESLPSVICCPLPRSLFCQRCDDTGFRSDGPGLITLKFDGQLAIPSSMSWFAHCNKIAFPIHPEFNWSGSHLDSGLLRGHLRSDDHFIEGL